MTNVDAGTSHELRSLACTYAAGVDQRDSEKLVSAFVPDAVMQVVDATRPDAQPMVGTQAIGLIATKIAHWPQTFHVLGQSSYRFTNAEQTEASGEVYCVANHRSDPEGDRPAMNRIMYIRYQDAYRHSEVGWRIVRREVHVDWTEDRPVTIDPG
jgi:hypothetical protein